MSYTANTKEGASCIALASTKDWRRWQDHGPILVGPATGYEPRFAGGHVQGSLESSNLSFRCGRWFLIFHAAIRDVGRGTWAVTSERLDAFGMEGLWKFWDEGACVEVVRDHGTRSLLAGLIGGYLRFAEVDWSAARPTARTVTDRETLERWNAL
jgi:hypothetical protein